MVLYFQFQCDSRVIGKPFNVDAIIIHTYNPRIVVGGLVCIDRRQRSTNKASSHLMGTAMEQMTSSSLPFHLC